MSASFDQTNFTFKFGDTNIVNDGQILAFEIFVGGQNRGASFENNDGDGDNTA